MSLFGSLIESLDNAFIWMGEASKQNLSDYCDLETAQDDTVLVARDGSLLTVLRLDGVQTVVGAANFEETMVAPLDSTLSNSFKNKAHMAQFFFTYDPERTQGEIRRLNEPALETMNRLGLDMGDMIEAKIANLSHWSCFESCHLALWTRPSSLGKTEKKIGQKRKKDADVGSGATNLDRSQNPNRGNMMIGDRHNAFVMSTLDQFKTCGVVAEKLEVHEAVRETRMSIDAEFTNAKWKASLPGDTMVPELRRGFMHAEEWDVVWPKLSWQVCPRDAQIVAANTVQIGSRIYAPLYVDLFPRRPTPFSGLFGNLLQSQLPWRASFMIEGAGLSGLGMKKVMAQLLGWSHSPNKLVSRAIENLEEYSQQRSVVKFRAAFCTWAKVGQPEELSRRAADLSTQIQNWGECDVAEVTGDPVAGFASSAVAFSYGHIGTPAAAPLYDAIKMMPLTRPHSPWRSGAVTFRSPDGKLMPYQPGSRLQATWINLIFAGPGSGKSVLMSMTNLALCLAPGLKRLPRLAIIDIGPSSAGLISLLQEALPAKDKHLAAYYRMRMTQDFAINPFDTQLGCRFPTSLERQFLINLVTLLATDVGGDEKPFSGMPSLVAQVVDEMYRSVCDVEKPHIYTPGIEPLVDAAMVDTMMHCDKRTAWWDVVDHLFKHERLHEASMAQRHAVPLLAEAARCAQDEKIKAGFEDVEIATKERLVQGFVRMMADTLVAYPVLAKPTAFDIGEARVVSLDLDEVAKTGGPTADRQTAVMYMLARYVLARDFYITKEALSDMPYSTEAKRQCPAEIPAQEYRNHHRERIEAVREDLKRICYDEFHRTSRAEMVRAQVLVDMREGRKWGVDVTLASQSLDDFDSTMVEFATGVFVMNGGTAAAVDKICKTFGLEDPAQKEALKNYVKGPRQGGGTFLAKFDLKGSTYVLLLTNTLGPIELWAFSTTATDVSLRTRLYERLGPKVARKVLAEQFPGGSAATEIEKRKEEMRSNGFSDPTGGQGVIDQLADELMLVAESMRRRGRL